ncbi:MAG: hypothetical protein M3O35_03285, partial [Acidobacteriota bacterium]|nr:hypothetical protein [Acidobacteriota bacterium]
MPIRIQALSEPFCVRPDGAPDPAPFARSAAYDQLFDEMLRYTRGETAGRSFLISGNRGAGKTTMVTRCIENIQKEMRNSTKPLRPIYVRLNGPDLLRPRQTTDDTAVMLREVTIALYRALADEFSRAFHNWFTVPSKNERAMRKLFDGVELAGQLAVELDGWPDLATLRPYWDRAGRLETGVLFPNADGQRHNQGILELIALSSAGQAFQQVSGEMQDKRQAALSAEDSQTTGIDSALKLKDLIAPFIAIGSGAAAAIGAGVLNTGPVTSLLSGCVVALASAVTFRVSRSRTRGAKVTQEVTFLPNRDVASLGRILPLLVERIRAAGLAPIFVVDELDKVDRLFDRMRDLVKHLKQFVTEHSFFCFITERSYFEQLAGDFADGGYPEEYTYFTDRLFVCFTAQALHEHLRDLLVIEYPAADQLETLSIEKALLPFILLRRSRLHMFDLVRELDALFTGRTLTLPPGTLRTQVFRY